MTQFHLQRLYRIKLNVYVEWVRIFKMVIASFKVLSMHLPGDAEEDYRMVAQDIQQLDRDLNQL